MILSASKRLRKFFNNTLTDEMICQQIIVEGKLENIHQLHALSPEAARVLIQHEKRMELLSLGITELSAEVAEELAAYQGEKLFLNCVTSLSIDAAKAIARFKGSKLMLNGISDLNFQILGRLASYQGNLYLDGVEDLEVSENEGRRIQTIFQNLECSKFSMAGLKTPSIFLLQALALFRGQLELNGIESLSAEEAEILGDHSGEALTLKGIRTLSKKLFKLFTMYTGFLDLSGAQVVEDDFLYILTARPGGFSLFSRRVKLRIEAYKELVAREKAELARETREIQRQELEHRNEIDQTNALLMAEFEKFDELELPVILEFTENAETQAPDPYSPEIEDAVVKDIELNLNQQIDKKKKQVNNLLRKGFTTLTESERALLQELRDQIERLKMDIRGTLDILVEKKELGAIVFTSSSDLAAYLKHSGETEDEHDALADIENVDLFSSSFDQSNSQDQEETLDKESAMAIMDMWGDSSNLEDSTEQSIEGNDFIITAV